MGNVEFFNQNFVRYAPSDNVQIKQPGHSTRRSYKVSGSQLLLHCLKGDPTLTTTRESSRKHNILWGYLKRNAEPIDPILHEALRKSVTRETWKDCCPSGKEGTLVYGFLLREGDTMYADWISSDDHIEKIQENGLVSVAKEWQTLGQLVLPSPEDYMNRPEAAFSSAKQAIQHAILSSAWAQYRCNIITLPLPKFDSQEQEPGWQAIIERALLEAVQESGTKLPNGGKEFHVVIIDPNEEPFPYPSE